MFTCNIVQGIHNRLQNEKSRLVTAIQACEAATACISRPTTPCEEAASQRETEARQTLEELIDQVSRFSGFGFEDFLCVCLFHFL